MNRILRISGITVLMLAWMIGIGTLLDSVQSGIANDITYAQKQSDSALKQEEAQPKEFDSEMLVAGREIFQFTAGGVGCAACHGSFGVGDLGNAPNIRGRNEEEIRGALGSIEEMDFLGLTDDEIKAVVEYLSYLGTLQPFKTYRTKGVFDPVELKLPISTDVQVIVQNNDRGACTFAIAGLELDKKEIKGRRSEDFIWTTPDEPTTFTGACEETPEEIVTIIVEIPQPESGGE